VVPDLRMHLFEPSAFTFKKIQSIEWSTAVNLNNFGLGERKEQLLLNIAGDGDGVNSIHQRQGVIGVEMKSTETIQIQTLDAYCEENGIVHIDFLKIDVEGHEIAVLKGASNMLSRQGIDLIQFEYGGCNLDARVYLLDIWNLLQSYGYVIGKIYPNSILMIDKYQQNLETFKYANFIAKIK
jgi:FkbM family methyltransferase